ncbi:MAG TPA: hypothetical protein VFB60_09535 [Ktedonobacteraceae bacterium]|nr:hypothetical protein [Ktedonobacteraceae bacterium]
MEHQEQQPVETLESQISQSSEERRDKHWTTPQSYRSPQVLLVGKAQRLMAAYAAGSVYDSQGLYTYP